MQRLRRAAFPLALVAASAVVLVVVVEESSADLENLVFTSREDGLRLLVPRGWRASDQKSYPGLVLWMARSQPPGQIVLATEAFTRATYCSWPVSCRGGDSGLPPKYACALRGKLEAQRFHVGPVQAGPKENEAAGLASVWFEYDDGRHYLRHAIAFSPDQAHAPQEPITCPNPGDPPERTPPPELLARRAISLVLSAPSNDARITHTRAFEQTLRTMRTLSEEEAARATGTDAGPADGAGSAAPDDSGVGATVAPAAPPSAAPPPDAAPATPRTPLAPPAPAPSPITPTPARPTTPPAASSPRR